MRQLLITGMLIWISSFAWAQKMDLEACVNYAFAHNLSLSTAHIHIDMAKEDYQQSKRNLLPSLEASSSANKQYGKSIDPTTNDFFNQQFFSANMYVASNITVFNGFVKQNNIRYAKYNYLSKVEAHKQRQIDIRFKVMSAFYDLIFNQNMLQVAEKQIELSQLNLNKVKKLVELGLKAPADVLEIESQVAGEVHQKIEIENAVALSKLTLKNIMNYPLHQDLVIDESFAEASAQTYDLETVYTAAKDHYPGLQQAELELKSANQYLKMQKGNLLPSLSLGAGYSTNFSDSRKEKRYPNNPNSDEMRVVPFANQIENNASQNIYLSLRIPIFQQWNLHSNVKQAKLQMKIRENALEETKQNLYKQITEDYQMLHAMQKELEQLKIQQSALEVAYKINEKKLEKGLVSILELYTAKNQLTNTEAKLLRTQLQIIIKEKTMDIYSNMGMR